MWSDDIAATQSRDEHLLGHHADAGALAKLRLGYQDALSKGYKILGSTITSPTAVSATPSAAPTDVQLTDCWSEGRYSFVNVSDNKQTGLGANTGYPITSEVRLEHGVWKVVSYENQAGAPACPPQ